MERAYSLAHLTTPGLHPAKMAAVAGRAGYTHIGLRMTPVTPGDWCFPLMDDRAMLRETRAAMAEAGVRLLDVEVLRLAPETDVAAHEPLLAVSAELGAKHMLTQIHDDDRGRALAKLAEVCDLATRYELTCDIEFLPWTANRSLDITADFVRAVGKSNAGVVIDTLHLDRSLSDPADIRALPRQWFRFIQLCDAPAERPTSLEGLLYQARKARDFPGQGGLDLKSILRELPAGLPISLEIPNVALDAMMPVEERISAALVATKALLAELDAEADDTPESPMRGSTKAFSIPAAGAWRGRRSTPSGACLKPG